MFRATRQGYPLVTLYCSLHGLDLSCRGTISTRLNWPIAFATIYKHTLIQWLRNDEQAFIIRASLEFNWAFFVVVVVVRFACECLSSAGVSQHHEANF